MKVYAIIVKGIVYDNSFRYYEHLDSLYTTKEKAELEAKYLQQECGYSIFYEVQEYELKE